jgi:hypothetical protein
MEPAGTSERLFTEHHTAGRYVPEVDVKIQTYSMYVGGIYQVHTKMLQAISNNVLSY